MLGLATVSILSEVFHSPLIFFSHSNRVLASFVSARVTASLQVAAAVYFEEKDSFSFTLSRQVIEADFPNLEANLVTTLSALAGIHYYLRT